MNTNEYLTAIEKFISGMYVIPDTLAPASTEAMEDLCYVLKIGKIDFIAYDNEASEHMGLFRSYCFYDCGGSSDGDYITRRLITPDDNIAVYKIIHRDGTDEWTELDRGRIEVFISLLSTFNARGRLLKLTHRLTFFDSELDMYNLRQFMKTVRVLCKAERIDEFTAVYFNLKRFSIVNQQIGRENGTRVMKKFIGMIDELLDHENEFVCRIGGDNFIIILADEKLESVLKLLSGVGITIDDNKSERIFISATVGVYVIPDMDSFVLPTDIMDRVSMAFHIAKLTQDVVFFDDALLTSSKRHNDITASFPKALADEEFLVYYQPKVSLDGRNIAGAEALSRWYHNGRLISPADFIPVLEQGRDICKLDFYVLDKVCRDIRRWLDTGRNVVRISVNLSRRHLSDMDLLDRIVKIIDKHKVPHELIEIELTETTTDVEFKDLKRTISGLQQTGISTSVDDFGIGYSSLNLIKELPWNVLKLDKSLLPDKNNNNDEQKGIMFKYIVAMAQEMGLECIAEGVETKEHVDLLTSNSCKLAQGYYFDKPLPVEEFETRLDANYIYDI
ncbi:putative bifunctional diguanylate cyclase/phosphodiesterase [Ruminococcus flavefaciens]|uniref:Diguanylate cyclase (GGDEF)-like protein n=1 Tax=Ruminococcus flavefaciens TaxID=1265 RepID=A0A315Y134_RUMFL|nr:bifunctional diguanylate cyclase/phosphodiesterase [Ruminococcus flavefaciens]PWJ12981.1 diguanylate cyclase (GGDEF)-like protein [Ruminococcus flavefaciens]SSA48545.1 diguanylate cyclase (GGDEF) domain-containing protein [Ruminococcus flavefaciens]